MGLRAKTFLIFTVVIFIAFSLLFSCVPAHNGNGDTNQDDDSGYPPAFSNLPDVTSIVANPSDVFILSLNDFVPTGLVEDIIPMPGSDSGNCYHPGAHVNFIQTTTRETVAIYAPLDGVITRVIKCFPTGDPGNQKYDIALAYAQRNGEPFELELGMEPMAGRLCDANEDYFSPYILVAEGETVTKGQLIARMVLEPNAKAHIHFHSRYQGIFMCPDIFSASILNQIDEHYLGGCEGNLYSTVAQGSICYLPASGESNAHY